MTDAASLPLDIARNPRERALLRLYCLTPEEKRAGGEGQLGDTPDGAWPQEEETQGQVGLTPRTPPLCGVIYARP